MKDFNIVQEALSRDPKSGEYRYAAGLYGLRLLYTGMRCGEMLALRWSNVDFEHGLLAIEKILICPTLKEGRRLSMRYVIVSPMVIPYDEFLRYRKVLPYYRNIVEEGKRIG